MRQKSSLRTIATSLLLGAIILGLGPIQAMALSFNPNRIIENADLSPAALMSIKRIQQFLNSQSGVLKSYHQTIDGRSMSAAEVIYRVSQEFNISPQFIMVTLQKEQPLITRTNPSERALQYAMGYGCPDSSPCNPEYAGLFTQIRLAAKQIRERYLTPLEQGGYTISGWKVGVTKRVYYTPSNPVPYDITPENNATAVLYTYTPWVHGNELFWNIWNKWFEITFPDGALLRAQGEGGIWLIRDGKRHPFHTPSAFFSRYNLDRVVDVPLQKLLKYDRGTPITFANFSLVQAPSGGVYLIVDDVKRPIVSREVFQNIGFNPEEIQRATWDELNTYKNGEKITMDSIYPSGILMQSKTTGAIFYIQDNTFHLIRSKEILRNQFGGRRWTQVEQSVIDSFVKGTDVRFRDGEIVTSPNANGVWYISGGKRRGIPSPAIFSALGLRWSNLIHTTDSALLSHPVGDPIDFPS